MTRTSRIIVFAVAGFAGLIVVGALSLYFLVGAHAGKARLEAIASEALGMDLSIEGRLRVGWFPDVLVTIDDLHIRNQGAEVASAKEATLEIDLLPLLTNEIRIEKVALKFPTISIVRDRKGQFNFGNSGTAKATLPAVYWPSVSVSDGTLVYTDQRSGNGFEARTCRLDAQDLRLSGGKRSSLLKDLSMTAGLACGEVRADGFTVSDLKFSAVAKNGVIDLNALTAQVFGTPGSGSVRADFSAAVPRYDVRYVLSQFPIEEFLKTVSQRKVATGRMDFSANLSMQGTTGIELLKTMNGQISLRGRNLTLFGSDLDREFSRFESSQKFSLLDVGAFFFAGPLGMVVTKGIDFARIAQGSGGSSEIRTLVSDWKVDRGVARARDVAMATRKNRVALQGGLDFVNDRFSGVTVALVDAKGCAKVRQAIRGPFRNPVVEKPSVIESLAGPALRLLEKGRELLLGGQCEVFYAGSVAAPK